MTATSGTRTGTVRGRGRLTRGEWASISVMAAVVLALTVVGWGVLVLVVAPAQYQVDSTTVFGVGLGLTAYTLGMRHAFDADHIAAIDNTTRKLMTDGQRPVSVGFWFSLGHSSIVFLLCVLLALGVRALAGQVEDESSTLQQTTGMIGISVSAVFLLVIGVVNLVVLRQILRVFRDMRGGAYDEATLEQHLANRGLMNRILSGATKAVRKPWHMYPVGLLFGLGFDTATEVSLLVLAGGAAAFELPWYAILTLPVLFAAGMTLLDSIDGCFMNFAYGWAFSQPVRKVYYNLTVTGLSVAVALLIGGIEVLSVVTEKLGLESGPVAWVGGLDLGYVGFLVVGLFVATWAVSLAVWRFGRVEERWTAHLRPAPAATERD
ncbi:HoxN/HupN/NixA family nickel/cobalt transporter [Cellulomonas dongxiuzhuiae]|uniref:HoxN/HupN/NixA family nickel/cobalt transporter n=1 Tax=Cellulomonas dongxiuzhuiae TaxID=2819979 RepID=UPI001FB9D3A6|nr:HoxN/HupN/NixA family nickel/cobalt transporter [Cellulomonas dongxiuzhuiae]